MTDADSTGQRGDARALELNGESGHDFDTVWREPPTEEQLRLG
jgi:hypothetical protein